MIDLNKPEIQALREQFRQNAQTKKMALKSLPAKPRLTKEQKQELAKSGKKK